MINIVFTADLQVEHSVVVLQAVSHADDQALHTASNITPDTNISVLHWSGEDNSQNPTSRIAIADHPGAHITISDPTGQISFADHNPVHISLGSGQGTSQTLDIGELGVGEHMGAGQISISQDPASGHIRILQELGSHIRIGQHPVTHIHISESSPGHFSIVEGEELSRGAVVSGASHIVHSLSPSQLPLVTSAPQLHSHPRAGHVDQSRAQAVQMMGPATSREVQLLPSDVHYEMEVDPSTLTQDDLNAVHMLTQASLAGHGGLQHQSQSEM